MLYFAYAALIAPARMEEAAPGASFGFIAHLPEWGLRFPIEGDGWNGALPTATPSPGSTVWGAVYDVPEGNMSEIDAIESNEGRSAVDLDAIDRSGKRYKVTTYLASSNSSNDMLPSREYLSLMLSGSKHWGLPAGWVIGLEDHLGGDA